MVSGDGKFLLSAVQESIKSFIAHLIRLRSDEEKREMFHGFIFVYL
jgi:hypothetical protein